MMALAIIPLEQQLSSLSSRRFSVPARAQRKNLPTRIHLPLVRAQDGSMEVLKTSSSAVGYGNSTSSQSTNVVLLNGSALQEAESSITSLPSALEPLVEKREGIFVLKEAFRAKLNPAEKVKLASDPMLRLAASELKGLKELAAAGIEAVDARGKEGKDDVDVRAKWLGLFHRRKQQYGRFMLRLRLPNGILTSKQMRCLATLIDQYGDQGCADITTRQNIQLRGVTLPDAPAVLEALKEAGLTSMQSGMDNVRNIVGSPLAGVDPHEVIDTRPFVERLEALIVGEGGAGSMEYANLPRKFNICVVGSHDLYEHPHINDLAFLPLTTTHLGLPSSSEASSPSSSPSPVVVGFQLLVGGFFSSKRCEEAVPLGVWVPADPAAVTAAAAAVVGAFRDLGLRTDRQKARLMWLIDHLGMDAFRAEVIRRMELAGFTPNVMPSQPSSEGHASWQRRELFGLQQQQQVGLHFAGLHVPVGRLQAGEMFELARVAEEYGCGEIRLTVEQNVIIPNVTTAKAALLLKDPLLFRLSLHPGNLMGSVVACTGSQFCGQAIIETKERARKLTEELDATMDVPRPVRMHWTGCPNSCGQVQVADIGFMGCMARDEAGKPCEGVHVLVGGQIGAESHLGEVYRSSVPCKDLLPVVQELLIEKFGATRE